jgi:hypothetical protein
MKFKCKQLEGTLKNANCEISISGPLFSAQLLNPGDPVYSCQETILTIIQTPLVKDGYKHIMTNHDYYTFVGRTGEKTFELKHTYFTGPMTKPVIEEKNSYYFDTNVPLELEIRGFFDCDPKAKKIQVKLIDLKGSKLECQVVLPDCLRDR